MYLDRKYVRVINHCLALCHKVEITPDTIIEKKSMDARPADNRHIITPSVSHSPALNKAEQQSC